MSRKILLVTSLFLAGFFGGTARGELRTWTDRNGQQIEAELSRYDEKTVHLWCEGKIRSIWLSELSDADQRYVRDIRAGKKSANTASTAAVAGESDAQAAQTSQTTPTLAQESAPSKSADEANDPTGDWVDLIDPSSFEKWTTVGAPDVFKLLPDATVRGAGGLAYLVSPKMYTDFELTGRMKVLDRGNGGVFFGVPRGMTLDNPRGYEVQLYVRKPGEKNGTGSIWQDGRRKVPLGGRFEVPDRWYSFSIRCHGSSILVKIDDQTVFEETDARGGGGHLALQCYETKGELHYADLKIRELSKSEETPPVASAADRPVPATSFSICGIQAGMTFQEIVPILKARGMRFRATSQPASFLNNSHLNNYATQGLSYVRNAMAERQDGQILTKLDIYLCEDLPDRPGGSICEEVTFRRTYTGRGTYPDVSPWFRQARNELVQRYGPPRDDDETSATWGDPDLESLYVQLGPGAGEISVELDSADIPRRERKGEEILIERSRPSAPEIKVDF